MGKGPKKDGGTGALRRDEKACCIVLRKGEVLGKGLLPAAPEDSAAGDREENEEKRDKG